MRIRRQATVGPDGTRWWVGRRMLPWRPRRRMHAWRPLASALDGLDDTGSDGAGLVFVAVIVAVVLLPVIVVLAAFVFEWLLVLLVLPLAMALRAWAGRPWHVVARQRGVATQRHAGRLIDAPHRFARDVRGWRASTRLIEAVRTEIRETGAPQSLGAEPLRQRGPSRAPVVGRPRASQDSGDDSRAG
ncbi:MAG TPA: hypothetical protein VFR11_19400 [Micromonosporaceae bacterium]|nr:hypothetical protein [Micromonosporaceae bacterium]